MAANEDDVVVDGVEYKGYRDFYLATLERMYAENILVGARRVGSSTWSTSSVISGEQLSSGYDVSLVKPYNLNSKSNDVEDWKAYVDQALKVNGWALFCVHRIIPDDETSNAIHIKQSQARELFSYTSSDDIWVATYEQACMYYTEWSTAEASVSYADGKITLSLTDDENNELYDEPLTVKVEIPYSWDGCELNGETLKIMKDVYGVRYVYVDLVPDSSSIEIISK